MDRLAANPAATGRSVIKIQRSNFTTAYRGIKAGIVLVLMWLSVIGGCL